jgi:acyl carrier protein
LKRWIVRKLPFRKNPPPPPIIPRPELFPKVRDILAKISDFPYREISPQTHLVNDLHLDSLNSIMVVLELEEEFDMEIPDDEAVKLFTVQDILQYLEKRLQQAEQASKAASGQESTPR